jgi:hypothetical protein
VEDVKTENQTQLPEAGENEKEEEANQKEEIVNEEPKAEPVKKDEGIKEE